MKDVLIPYTTREDTFNYYEERNYVNDVNREHTEVLQTYDRELKAKETYTYGNGRASYLNNETGKHYNYLTDQSGSVTGLTQDGSPVASSSYTLYGSTKASTDITGNPFAYNGEARDVTGLDYLRARYYDSQAGTFLTEDSYQGEATDPLSQNRYSYVHNNPVNYTDPSGHFWKSIKKAWNGVKKVAGNVWNSVKRITSNAWNSVTSAYNTAVNWVSNKVNQVSNWVGQQWNTATNWVGQQWNNIYHAGQQAYQSASNYTQAQYQQVQAQIQAQRHQAVRDEFTQATGIKDAPKSREGKNLLRNWGSALAKTLKHVCTTAKRVGKQIVKAAKKINWKKVAIVAVATVAAVAVTVATAGAAGPIIAAGVSGLGLSGAAATVVTAAAVGAVSGAAGGAVSGFTTSVLSGDKPKDILANTFNGAVNGFVSGGLTGGLVGGVSTATSSVTGPAARYAVDTLGETMADTIADAAQGGKVTPSSIATSFVINAVSDGVSARGVKGAKADVPKNKPKAGDVSIKKSPKDTTPVQQLALPGPKSQPLALPAPQNVTAGTYRSMSKSLRGTDYQAHHVNQAAMMKKTVPNYSYSDGVTVPLVGNIRTDVGSPHYNAHAAMEDFYDQYRRGGDKYRTYPTVGEYNDANATALRAAGLNDAQVDEIISAAKAEQRYYGLNDTSYISIPRRIYLPPK